MTVGKPSGSRVEPADLHGRSGLALRARLFAQRFWQPTSACLSCMPGHGANFFSAVHWEIALRTGLLTGALVLLLSFTRFVTVFRHRVGNAIAVGVLTAIGDFSAHPDHYGSGYVEPVITGMVSAMFAYVGAWLLEDRARRLRTTWRRVTGRSQTIE